MKVCFDELKFKDAFGVPKLFPEPFVNRKAIEEAFPSFKRRPDVSVNLNVEDKKLALKNALRYFPSNKHKELAEEFLKELEEYGHIYMYRFCPYRSETEFENNIRPFTIGDYLKVCKTVKAAAIILMIQNNLCRDNAQFPLELITYGSNGSVFQNWIQYRLTLEYLAEMKDDQTLHIYSGHPMGCSHLRKTLQKS